MMHIRLTVLIPALLVILQAACTPPAGIGDVAAEPVLSAPVKTTERAALPTPCEDDDGIGGTGCPIE